MSTFSSANFKECNIVKRTYPFDQQQNDLYILRVRMNKFEFSTLMMYVSHVSACVRVDRSFGVLLWEMFTFGYMPYPGRSNLEVIDTVMAGARLDIPSTCPTTVGDVMLGCWARDADQRPSFAYIVQRLQVHSHSSSASC